MSENGQSVVCIQDASSSSSSREVCASASAIRRALRGLYLKPPHDKITLVPIIQPFKSATTSSTMGCGGLLAGYRRKLDSSATLKRKQELLDREIAKKLEEYHNNPEIQEIIKLYEMQQIEFQIIVEAGHSLKAVAVQTAKKLGATCVILDRGMKKDGKYMMENLTCGIQRLKHDNKIEHLRESKAIEFRTIATESGDQQCDNNPETSYKEFTYEELRVATNYFSHENLVSKGDDDYCKQVYRGQLPNGMQILITEHTFFSDIVRRHTRRSIKLKEFKSEVQALGKARHDNIVMLLGSCSDDGLRLLVYHYVCADTSLDHFLSKKTEELTWEARLKVAAGAAKGLQYLHRNDIYGNVRSYNIFITHDHQPQLGNFGVTRNQYEESSEHSSGGRVMRTFEYLAPEYEDTGKDSSKTDIYSLGVVLLELITGRRTIEDTRGQTFLRWGRPLVEEKKYGELIDPTLVESPDLHQLFHMVHVVETCLDCDPHKRPSIDEMVTTLSCMAQGCNIKVFSPPESSEGSEE